MSSVATTLASSKRAMQYTSDYDYWFVLGKTTPWIDEDAPPHPSSSFITLPEAAYFVYAHTNRIVYPSQNGVVRTNIGSFSYANTEGSAANLASLNGSYVFTEGLVLPSKLPEGFTYRALGIAANVQFKQPVTRNVGALATSANVLSYDLEWVSFFRKIEPQYHDSHNLRIIRRF
jgi:hypothetical protein